MFLVAIEDDATATWYQEPDVAKTPDKALEISRQRCPQLPPGFVRVIYTLAESDVITPELEIQIGEM